MMSFEKKFPLLESILLVDGQFPLLEHHQERMNYSAESFFGQKISHSLKDWMIAFPFPKNGKFKCRVLYGKTMQQPEYHPYQLKAIKSLQLTEANDLEYSLKYSDRAVLNKLYESRGTADDVLIVKHGLITDTSYCNIAFFDGKSWFTPDQPLLKGVRRAFLLEQGLINEAEIRLSDLKTFSHFKCFNAMIGWDEAEIGKTGKIFKGQA
jgi:4-amino-4-deoxychorismate lyase